MYQKKMRDKNFNVNDLQAILGDINDSIVLMSREGEILWSNNAFRRFAEEIDFSYEDLFTFFDKNSYFDLRECVEQSDSSETTKHFEAFFHSFNRVFLLHVTALDFGITIRFEEIAAQKPELEKRNEHVLIDERNLRILINITDHPIWLVDVNCNIVLCNDAFRKWIFNFSGKELSTGENVLANDLDATYLEKLSACYDLARTGKNFTAIEDIKVGDEVKFTTINFNPVFDKSGALSGISCHASDITDHRKNLSKIEAQTQLLMEIANIQSHKVRGPVATLLGLVHVFNYEDIADPNNIEVMQGVAQVSEKLDEVVTDVIRSINLLSYRNQRPKSDD